MSMAVIREPRPLSEGQKLTLASAIENADVSDWVRADSFRNLTSPRFELKTPYFGETVAVTFNRPSSNSTPHYTVELSGFGTTKVWNLNRTDSFGGRIWAVESKLNKSQAADRSKLAEFMTNPALAASLVDATWKSHLGNKAFNSVVVDAKVKTSDGKDADLHIQFSKQTETRGGMPVTSYMIEARIASQHGKFALSAYPDVKKGEALFKQMLEKC